ERTQAGVFLFEALVALNGGRFGEELLLELAVAQGERAIGCEIARNVSHPFAGELKGALHGEEHGTDRVPDVLEITVTGVGEQQRERNQSEECEAGER